MALSLEETKISGRRIARGNATGHISAADLLAEINEGKFDVCRLKVNSAPENLLEQLDALGVPYYIHSVLVRNSIEISGEKFEIPANIRFELYNGENPGLISKIIEECLGNRTSTFYSNKVFSQLVNETMEMDMAKAYLSSFVAAQNTGKVSWLIYADETPAAFLAGTVIGASFEGAYYGVIPAFRGKYNLPAVIMRFIKNWCADNNISTFINDVPYQNLKSLVSIIRESILPVSTYLHVTLLPLLSYQPGKPLARFEKLAINDLLVNSISLVNSVLGEQYRLDKTSTAFFTPEKVLNNAEVKTSVVDAGEVLMYVCKFYTDGILSAAVYLKYKMEATNV